jgi:hypothetical protein
MIFRRAESDVLDIILVDTLGITTDYLAYQLASRGSRVHLFTPSSHWPLPFMRGAYPYRSFVPFGDKPLDPFLAMVERVNPACIIPCTEKALYWMWTLPDHIQERCLPNVAPAIRPLLHDRALLLEKAAEWGVATPDSMVLINQDDCRAAIEKGLPLVVKSGQSIASTGVAMCNTPDEVFAAFDKFSQRATSVTAQRYYVGPTYMAGGLFVHGEAAHFYAGKQTIMWPPQTGYSFEVRSAGEPHFSELLRATEAVCKNLDWTGLAAFDFVFDEHGQFRFVDFNPRLWGSAGAGVAAKVDLYGGIDSLLRHGNAGTPTRSIPEISHRVFPKYTVEPSNISMWRRLTGLRDAPWDTPFLAISELAYKVAFGIANFNAGHRRYEIQRGPGEEVIGDRVVEDGRSAVLHGSHESF